MTRLRLGGVRDAGKNRCVWTAQEAAPYGKDKGFIYTEPTTVHLRNGRTRNGNLRYTVRPIADAIERYEENLLAAADQARAQQEYQQRVEAYDLAHPDEQTSTLKASAS